MQRGIVLALLGRGRDAVTEAEQGVAAMPAEHRGAGRLADMLTRIDPEMTAST
ncbi:hypothetical protein ACLMAL_10370 [Nocardia sp. CWNU-33]|uniref:hypothetical protein n=1 Tax=Nocardia sp. CWNU-33 TaxID=3392117 RepID=UPI00398E75B6